MRHRKKGKILDRKTEPRNLMLRNMASSILIYEKITTTKAKAKAVQPMVEKCITLAKKGDLASRRRLIAVLPQKMAIKKSLEVLKDRFKDKTSGFTRIIKVNRRQGDGAEMVKLELT